MKTIKQTLVEKIVNDGDKMSTSARMMYMLCILNTNDDCGGKISVHQMVKSLKLSKRILK